MRKVFLDSDAQIYMQIERCKNEWKVSFKRAGKSFPISLAPFPVETNTYEMVYEKGIAGYEHSKTHYRHMFCLP